MESGTHHGRAHAPLHAAATPVVDWLVAAPAEALLSRASLPAHAHWLPAAANANSHAAHLVVSVAGDSSLMCMRGAENGAGSNCASQVVHRAMHGHGTVPLTPHVLCPFARVDAAPATMSRLRASRDGITVWNVPVVPRGVLFATRSDSALAAFTLPAHVAAGLLLAMFQLHHASIALVARFPRCAFRSVEEAMEVFLPVDGTAPFVYHALLPTDTSKAPELCEGRSTSMAVFAAFVHWDGFQPFSEFPASVIAILAGCMRALLCRAVVHAALIATHSTDALLLQSIAGEANARAVEQLNVHGGAARVVTTLCGTIPSSVATAVVALCTALETSVTWDAPEERVLNTRCKSNVPVETARHLLRTAYDPVVTWERAAGRTHGGAFNADSWGDVPFGQHAELLARAAAMPRAFSDEVTRNWVLPDARLAPPRAAHVLELTAAATLAGVLGVVHMSDQRAGDLLH